MSRQPCHRGILILAAWAAAAAVGLAVTPEVQDQGKFFSADAVKKADERIREIYRKHNLDVLLETYQTIPGTPAEKVKAMDNKARAEFFLKWAKERTKARVVNGLYVLINREPRYLYVLPVGRGEKAFTQALRDKLIEAIRGEFKEDRFNEGLDAAVRVVEKHLEKSSAK